MTKYFGDYIQNSLGSTITSFGILLFSESKELNISRYANSKELPVSFSTTISMFLVVGTLKYIF